MRRLLISVCPSRLMRAFRSHSGALVLDELEAGAHPRIGEGVMDAVVIAAMTTERRPVIDMLTA
jgi:hypothetical protein